VRLILVVGGALAALTTVVVAIPLLLLVGAPASASGCGGTGSIGGHPVPAGVELAARPAAQQTGVPEQALLALTYRETQWGQAAAGVPDDQAVAWLGDLAGSIDVTALGPGGTVATEVGRPQGIRLGDWINPQPIGGEHAVGFAQFLPSTWRSVGAAHQRPGGAAWNPYSPADALILAGYYLADLLNASGGNLTDAVQRYGTVNFQSAYAELRQTWRDVCAARFTVSDPFGGRCHPTTVQAYHAVELFTPDGLHHGIDLACQDGSPLFAVTAGQVFDVASGCINGARNGCGAGYGNHVVVRFRGRVPGDTGDHDYYVIYAHMRDAPLVHNGDQVQPGTQLGVQGDTGLSWGSHLHFEVDRDSWQTLKSIDPSPFLSPTISRTPQG